MKARITIIGITLIFVLTGCRDEFNTPSENTPIAIFDKVWQDFDTHYSYFMHKQIDWDQTYTTYRSRISNNMSSGELSDVLGEMTLELRDLHVNFKTPTKTYHYTSRNRYALNPRDNAINYLNNGALITSKLIIGTIKESNIVYLQLKSLAGQQPDFTPLNNLKDQLVHADGFIIDVRDNGGGNDAIAKMFVRHLAYQKNIYEYVRFRNGGGRNDFGDWIPVEVEPYEVYDYSKSILVLTNRGTYSSAESFVLMLKTIPTVTVIGDTTGGTSGNPVAITLDNGWSYSISRWQAVTPQFELIEDRGIYPDVTIIMSDESISRGRDTILEVAIERLKSINLDT